MKKLYLNIWWHMHQPLYKNPVTDIYELPWVFLHSLKDYLEMPLYLKKFGRIKVNFNITPVLMDQIEEYAKGYAKCKLLNTVSKDPALLEEDEIKFFLNLINLMTQHLKNRIVELDKLIPPHSDQDFTDLQVLYILSWIGDLTLEGRNIIRSLLSKGGSYTAEDKEKLLKETSLIIREIIPVYKELQKERRITVTTSPYYHPILPLLFDMECAKEASPHIELPALKTSFEEDAKTQLIRAVERYEKIFGTKPFAFWPSEGSVSERTLHEISGCGIRMVATDEAILYNSGYKGSIYGIFSYTDKILLLFRDRELSDRIGFVYHHWKEEDAVEDFVRRLRHIYETEERPLVSIILDGENCWEYYPQNGKRFLHLFYEAIEQEKWIETVTLDELLKLNLPVTSLCNIKAGSWINGNFLKWIGNPEKNKFWEYLIKAKEDINNSEYLLVAEGSDWFWWQGEEEKVPFLEVFELLFFNNLKRAYTEANIPLPEFLKARGI